MSSKQSPSSISNEGIGDMGRGLQADMPFCVTFPGFSLSKYVTFAGHKIVPGTSAQAIAPCSLLISKEFFEMCPKN